MRLDGATVLVTGAGGFIGSHLVEELSANGARVRAFVRYNSRADKGNLRLVAPEVFEQLDMMLGDLRDPGAVLSAAEGADVIFHLGALIAIPYSYIHPREVVETNVLGTLNVLEAARRTAPARVVHISTSEVYGTARFVPISEIHPMRGQSPYSASKIGADRVAESYYRAFGVPVVTVRPFNSYGPRQSTRAVIPTIITQALSGNRLVLGSTAPTRDFTFVTDTVRGMIRAAEADGVEGLEVNLATGNEISIGALAERILAKVGFAGSIEVDEQRLRPEKSEVERLCGDATLARQRLGWEPVVDLDEGLERTIEWLRTNLSLYSPDHYQL